MYSAAKTALSGFLWLLSVSSLLAGAALAMLPCRASTSFHAAAGVELAPLANQASPKQASSVEHEKPFGTVTYTNTEYRFRFSLPESWKGFHIVKSGWHGQDPSGKKAAGREHGPSLAIAHPLSTKEHPRQDIPIMIFTLAQWTRIANGTLSVSAAPIPPSELGRNQKYVFALPPRYNYAFPEGYQEVEQILASAPLHPF